MRPSRDGPWPRASTRLYGVFGHPVSHSLSPVFQNAAFRALGLDACYLAFDVPPERFAEALAGALALGAGGLNVTVPHKEQALRLASEADSLAAAAGAANTLVPLEGGRGWKAHNTDVAGLLRALRADLDFDPRGRRCVVLGAGGAARAAVVGLLHAGIQEILVVNRNRERAEGLVAALAGEAGAGHLASGGLRDAPASDIGPGDLLLSATPLGLGAEAAWPWDLGRFDRGILIYDMAYGTKETALVEEARGLGFRAASGKRMLLWQGAEAFALWTGVPAPLEAMERALATWLSCPPLRGRG